MNLHEYKKAFDDMEPENQYEQRLLSCLEQQKSRRNPRLLRVPVIAAVLVLVLCGGVFAASRVNWNEAYRQFFHIESESVQGFVEYPPVEPEEKPTLQPVSCVTGIQTLDIRFSYGPIDREQAEETFEISVEELEFGPISAGLEDYDQETGMALLNINVWYDVLPEQITVRLQHEDETALVTMNPEVPQFKTAALNLRTLGPDGQAGGLVALKVDAGSYCWVEDIPGMEAWEDFDEAIRDPQFSQYITQWDNLLLDEFMKDAYLTFADGTTKTLGAGVSCTWDGAHYCQWGGGVYDVGKLVSVTVGDVEYLFE